MFGTWTGHLTYTVELDDNPITFEVLGMENQAEKGMTWADWVESDYNYNTIWYVNDSFGQQTITDGFYTVMEVLPTDIIEAGRKYITLS